MPIESDPRSPRKCLPWASFSGPDVGYSIDSSIILGDGAVFHYQYKDQKIIDVYPTDEQPLINLGKSKIDGGDLILVIRSVRSLTLRASVTSGNSECGGSISPDSFYLTTPVDVQNIGSRLSPYRCAAYVRFDASYRF